MYLNEIKNNLKAINDSKKAIDNEIVNIKIAIHNLEKLGINTKKMMDLLDEVGIEYYKFKEYSTDFIKEHLK